MIGHHALKTTRYFLHCLKKSGTLVNKWLEIGPKLLPIVRKFCILLHYQASHTEVSKRNSNFNKRNEVHGGDASRIRWRRVLNVNKTIEIMPLVSRGSKKILS